MSQRIPRLSAAYVEKILGKNGFVLTSQRGSHRKWRSTDNRIVIVPMHKGRILPLGTLRSIMNASELGAEAWRE